jgi:hypothetical protein
MKAATKKLSDEQIVKQIIKKYGNTIDLKQNPFIMTEILRDFRSQLEPGDGGLPPGGVGPVGPASRKVDNAMVLQEILKLSRDVASIKQKLNK